jgi:hypothetical protein
MQLTQEDKLNLCAYAIAKNMVDNKERLGTDIQIAKVILLEKRNKPKTL